MKLPLIALGLAISAPALAAGPPAPSLAFPLACTIGATCEIQHYLDLDAGPGVRDYHGGRRTYDGHNGVDLRVADLATAARTDVLAAAPGRVARLRDGVADVSIRAGGAPDVEGRECGNGVVIDHGGGWETQYCHLAKGSLKVKVGDVVKAGQPIGRVGLSGDTEFAHLHLSVRHDGVIVDPFAPAPGAAPLWNGQARKLLAYKAGAVLNVGFAAGPVDQGKIEAAPPAKPGRDSAALVAYGRAIELERGDEIYVALRGPGGGLLGENHVVLDRDKAQYLIYAGRKRPPTGWPAGRYAARLEVRRGGKVALARDAELRF
jgi:hypothetical protein